VFSNSLQISLIISWIIQVSDLYWAPLITPFCFPTWAFFQLLRLPAGKGKFQKYSFSDSKSRFWRLVSKKNISGGIPNEINRGALYCQF